MWPVDMCLRLMRQYYEAVGHIPRYNEAPKWNDTASTKLGETSLQAEMQEHQNKVSRHRETVGLDSGADPA